jgi:hypothetical protein
MFYLKDSTEVRGELLALIDDSLIIKPATDTSAFRSIWKYQVESVVFYNRKSPIIGGIMGTIGGTLAGALGGLALGYLVDPPNGHMSGWGALIGFFMGASVGSVTGLVLGIISGMNDTVWIEDAESREELLEYTRFKEERSLRAYRGY